MRNNRVMQVLQNISYSFISNIISMAVGILSILIIPKFIGVDTFGYYQLYIFYGSYATITALGWADGNYLQIGGKEYDSLNKREQSTQFWTLSISQTLLYLILAFCALSVQDGDKRSILILTCICAIVIESRYYLNLLLQATNRIKEYSQMVITERVISVVVSIIIVMAGYRSYLLLIILDILGRFLSLCLGVWYCRDLVLRLPKFSMKSFELTCKNISAGSMVLFATLSSSLIIGVVRFGIENHWDIITFSKVSLTISISNMATRAINAVGIVMFPALRRTEPERLPVLYGLMNTGLMIFIFTALIFYYPCAKVLELWLPQYADSVRYAAILLPVCAYECKNAMLVSTYLKTMRMEKAMLLINLIAIAFSVVCTGISVYWFSIEFAVFSMLVALMIRCIAGELFLGHHMQIKMTHILAECFIVVAFVVANWYWGIVGTPVYLACYLIYIMNNKQRITNTQKFLKNKIMKERV